MPQSPFDILKGPQQYRNLQMEGQKLPLEIEKLQEPDSDTAGNMRATSHALALLPYAKMTTKQALWDQKRDPRFNSKFMWLETQYNQHPENFLEFMQQRLAGSPNLNDPTTQHIMRYLSYNGQLYAIQTPALLEKSKGVTLMNQQGVHVPNWNRVPAENWTRLRDITPRIRTDWDQLMSNPRTRPFANRLAAAALADSNQYKAGWSKQDFDVFSPGLKAPAKVRKGDARYKGFETMDAPDTAVGMYKNGKLVGYMDAISNKPYFLPNTPNVPPAALPRMTIAPSTP